MSCPVVLRKSATEYRMYYYGRSGNEWNMGVKPFSPLLPTGRVGVAISSDGITFQRHTGHLLKGAILDPSHDPLAFDCVHIGVSDVVQTERQLLLYYFGGGSEESLLFGFGTALYKGVKFRPGLAFSADGFSFPNRQGPILDLGQSGSWDQYGVSWPRVLPSIQNQKWIMTYHGRESGGWKDMGFFSAALAISDDGITWAKMGKILSAGPPGSWDENGVSVRHVIRIKEQYVMFYEGSNYKFDFAIGIAISDDGMNWRKDEDCGDEPGGPIFKARKGVDAWDNVLVGTPYLLAMPDGSFRMYYLGVGKHFGQEQPVPAFG